MQKRSGHSKVRLSCSRHVNRSSKGRQLQHRKAAHPILRLAPQNYRNSREPHSKTTTRDVSHRNRTERRSDTTFFPAKPQLTYPRIQTVVPVATPSSLCKDGASIGGETAVRRAEYLREQSTELADVLFSVPDQASTRQ